MIPLAARRFFSSAFVSFVHHHHHHQPNPPAPSPCMPLTFTIITTTITITLPHIHLSPSPKTEEKVHQDMKKGKKTSHKFLEISLLSFTITFLRKPFHLPSPVVDWMTFPLAISSPLSIIFASSLRPLFLVQERNKKKT
jgi:hypothetical protein